MKENREVTDTNVEGIEEALEKLSTGKKIKMYELLRTFKREGIENFVTTRKKYVDVILSDYKRVLKENEELKQEKINNHKMIALAQTEALGYMRGYEDGKNSRTSAIASIVENQQYYIIKKQKEKYEEYIEKLQKENNKLNIKLDDKEAEIQILKDDIKADDIEYKHVIEILKKENEEYSKQLDLDYVDKNYISKQEIEDKIEEIEEKIKYEYNRIILVQLFKQRKVLKELLEGRK